jgi:hypothetical protein
VRERRIGHATSVARSLQSACTGRGARSSIEPGREPGLARARAPQPVSSDPRRTPTDGVLAWSRRAMRGRDFPRLASPLRFARASRRRDRAAPCHRRTASRCTRRCEHMPPMMLSESHILLGRSRSRLLY